MTKTARFLGAITSFQIQQNPLVEHWQDLWPRFISVSEYAERVGGKARELNSENVENFYRNSRSCCARWLVQDCGTGVHCKTRNGYEPVQGGS